MSEMSVPGTGQPLLSKQDLHRRIEGLAFSADAKAILLDLADVTVDVGGKLVEAGRRILSFAFDMVRRFPNTTFGCIVGYTLTALVASIPWLGPALATLLGPLLLAMGIGAGALADLKERALITRVETLERDMLAVSSTSA